MINDHEQFLAALFTQLSSSVVVSFTGDTSVGSPDISGINTMAKMFVGLPVFGDGIPAGAVIDSIDIGTSTVTLSAQATKDGSGTSFKTGFLVASRRAKIWSDPAAKVQPALYVRHVGVKDRSDFGALTKTSLSVEAWIYCAAIPDPTVAADTTLKYLVRAIREALAPDDADRQVFTLGGMVNWCGPEGDSDYDPGDIDNQCKACIPIEILLP